MGIKLRDYVSDIETFFTDEEVKMMFIYAGYLLKK